MDPGAGVLDGSPLTTLCESTGPVSVTTQNEFGIISQSIPGERPDRFHHPKPGKPAGRHHLDHGLVRKSGDALFHAFLRQRIESADSHGRFKVERPPKHCETGEEAPIGLVQQAEAPVDDSLEGSMPGKRGALGSSQQREAVVQAICNGLGRESGGAGCSEFDRQGYPVEATTDIGHGRKIPSIHLGPSGRGSVNEELNCSRGERLAGSSIQFG